MGSRTVLAAAFEDVYADVIIKAPVYHKKQFKVAVAQWLLAKPHHLLVWAPVEDGAMELQDMHTASSFNAKQSCIRPYPCVQPPPKEETKKKRGRRCMTRELKAVVIISTYLRL